jgi:hypothetical protein
VALLLLLAMLFQQSRCASNTSKYFSVRWLMPLVNFVAAVLMSGFV